ncbi:transketolase [Arcobacter sp.]|uniref:transketolase n=1 Tax=Arcobacter sp. TaxID=1872629 RepID=UPI003C77BCA9
MTEEKKNISLQMHAYNIRRYALLMGEVQGQGYIAQALGVSDMLAVTYFHAMKYKAEDPEWEGRDRFFLSNGHFAIAAYAVFIEAGILPEDEYETYGSDDSRLPMSGMAQYTPGMEISGGSLGHGIGIAVGSCLALKRKKSNSFVYVMYSDGELNEGHTWEAAMSAAHHEIDNLIVMVDLNKQQADDHTQRVLDLGPIEEKFESFGWYTQRVNGNDIDELVIAFDNAKNLKDKKPRVILCDTKMAKGVPFLEEREKNHFLNVEPEEWEKAIQILDSNKPIA